MNIPFFGRKQRTIDSLRFQVSELQCEVDDGNEEYEFLADQFAEFCKQLGLRTGMNPPVSQEQIFARQDVLQRHAVARDQAMQLLAGVDWNGNPSQEEIVTASIAALSVLR